MQIQKVEMAPSPRRMGVLRISQFINIKDKFKIGNWNIRSMNQLGKIQQVENEFKKYGLDILALCETRCKEIGKETLEGEECLHLLRKNRWSWQRRSRHDLNTKSRKGINGVESSE